MIVSFSEHAAATTSVRHTWCSAGRRASTPTRRWPGADRGTKTVGGWRAGPTAPPEVNGLVDVQQFPLLAGVALVVLGVIATSHALIVTVRRRRLELGVLSSLGLAPGQRRAVILAQATTIAAVALVVGVPLGAGASVAGLVGHRRVDGCGHGRRLPDRVLAAGAVGFVVVMNLIAVFPARSARRLRVAEALRSE